MQVLLLVSAISLFAMRIEDSTALSQIEFWLSVNWKKLEPVRHTRVFFGPEPLVDGRRRLLPPLRRRIPGVHQGISVWITVVQLPQRVGEQSECTGRGRPPQMGRRCHWVLLAVR